MYQAQTQGEWGVGIDAVSALDCWGVGLPGFDGLKLEPGSIPGMGFTPAGYADTGGSVRLHFPDGNATIARGLVRRADPGGRPGQHRRGSGHRARGLCAPRSRRRAGAAAAQQHGGARAQRRARRRAPRRARDLHPGRPRAHGARARMRARLLQHDDPVSRPRAARGPEEGACTSWSRPRSSIPASRSATHARLPSSASGASMRRAAITPRSRLNAIVDIGDYHSPRSPDEPTLVWMVSTPCKPGLSEHDQNRAGRAELLATPFEVFERNIRAQLGRMLGAGGLRSGRGHHRDHGESLAARLRAGAQFAVGAGAARGRAAARARPSALWPHGDRQFRLRRRRLHRRGHRPGAPRRR